MIQPLFCLRSANMATSLQKIMDKNPYIANIGRSLYNYEFIVQANNPVLRVKTK